MHNSLIPASGAALLASTGINSVWYGLASFALVAPGRLSCASSQRKRHSYQGSPSTTRSYAPGAAILGTAFVTLVVLVLLLLPGSTGGPTSTPTANRQARSRPSNADSPMAVGQGSSLPCRWLHRRPGPRLGLSR
jgi:hypothetical protein